MPPWGCKRGQRALFITMAMCNTHNTQVGSCVVIFCLLLLFPKLSVPAVLIAEVICGCRNGSPHVCLDSACRPYLSTRLHPVKDVRPHVCLQVSLMSWRMHITQQRTFVLLCSLSLQQREAEGWGARAGQHRSSLCREKLGMKLKLPSKARAGTVT